MRFMFCVIFDKSGFYGSYTIIYSENMRLILEEKTAQFYCKNLQFGAVVIYMAKNKKKLTKLLTDPAS